MRQLSALLAFALLGSGCYSWSVIKPTELPKLNEASTTTQQKWGSPRVIVLTVAKLETPDGRIVQIEGESDARVNVRDKGTLSFEHPIVSAVDADRLIIQSAKRAKTTIPLANIERVEVSQFERAQTSAAVGVISLVVGGIAILLLLS